MASCKVRDLLIQFVLLSWAVRRCRPLENTSDILQLWYRSNMRLICQALIVRVG